MERRLGELHERAAADPLDSDAARLIAEVRALGAANALTERIEHFLLHPALPVDIRHNAKIFREKLAVWAEKQQKKSR